MCVLVVCVRVVCDVLCVLIVAFVLLCLFWVGLFDAFVVRALCSLLVMRAAFVCIV